MSSPPWVHFGFGTRSATNHENQSTSSFDQGTKFGEEIYNMYIKGDFTDVEFKFKDEEKVLKAHKTILSCRSPVFAAMFSSGMAEAQSSSVLIEDCEVGVFDCFLRLMHGAPLVLTKAMRGGDANAIGPMMAEELIGLCHKYEAKGLLEMLEQRIPHTFTVNAVGLVVRYLFLAGKYELHELEKSCIKFIIKEGVFGEVRKIELTQSLKVGVLLEMMDEYCAQNPEPAKKVPRTK